MQLSKNWEGKFEFRVLDQSSKLHIVTHWVQWYLLLFPCLFNIVLKGT
jgi:hypothetical protein